VTTPDDVMLRARAVWHRLDEWFAAHAPEMFESLRPGVSEEQLDAAESTLGIALHQELRAVWRVHNGASYMNVLQHQDFLSLDESLAEWRGSCGTPEAWDESTRRAFAKAVRSDPPKAVSLNIFERGWVAIGRDGCGNHLAVDHAPGPRGTFGQVTRYGAADWSERRIVYAPSLLALLSTMADRLERGELRVRIDEYGSESLVDDDDEMFGEILDELGRS
jgi:cell wall assembly regulator SMI1